jgi:hypothetical protein
MPHPKFKLILDPNLYRLNQEELALLKQLTKINDEDRLKEHVMGIQREAFEVSSSSKFIHSRLELIVTFRSAHILVFETSTS